MQQGSKQFSKMLEEVHLCYSKEFMVDTSKVHGVSSKEFI